MRILGTLWGIIALLIMLIAFIPLLGWLNWLSIPFAVIGLIFNAIVDSRNGKTLCIVAIIVGVLRLMMGGGIL